MRLPMHRVFTLVCDLAAGLCNCRYSLLPGLFY
nr:MAG TPA: hypothetical protein [Caudoviricetes sp.]